MEHQGTMISLRQRTATFQRRNRPHHAAFQRNWFEIRDVVCMIFPMRAWHTILWVGEPLLVGSGSDDLGWFWALEIGKGLVNSANTPGIYGIFTYISFVFDGKGRNLYNTWMVWDMVSVSGQIQPPNTSIQLQMIRHLVRLIQFFSNVWNLKQVGYQHLVNCFHGGTS